MADSRRWKAGSGVRRDDEFTRAPTFRDGHDSAPLDAQARWHGSGPSHVSFAVGLAVLAGIAAVAFMLFAPDDAADPVAGGAAAGQDPDALDPSLPGAIGNATSGAPSPTGLPPLPSVPPLP